MKKLTTKLMISVLSVALALVALGTSTFAWFSMNTTVSATGMEMTATAPINLLISNKADGTYSNTCTADEIYNAELKPASATKAILSSATGAAGAQFNAVQDGQLFGSNGEGGASIGSTAWMETGTPNKVSLSGETAADGYYLVYDFYLKSASNADDGALVVYLSELNIEDATVSSAAVPANLVKAVRVAMYVGTELKAIYDSEGSGVAKTGVGETLSSGATYTSGAESVAISDVGNSITFDVATDAVKVTFLVWIEGEDAATVNSNGGAKVKLSAKWAVKEQKNA